MEVVKFDPLNIPAWVNKKDSTYWIITDGNCSREDVDMGDYLIYTNYPKRISKNDYQSDFLLKHEVHEIISKIILKDIYKKIQDENITQANEADVMNRIQTTVTALTAGFIRAARNNMNATAIGGVFTVERKAWILARIDTEISKL